MPTDVIVPTVGESITEGTLARWLKQNGQSVREGDPLFELETDKATSEVPAPASGILEILQFKEGQTVNVGDIVARITAGDGAAAKPVPQEKPPEAKQPEKNREAPTKEAAPVSKPEKPAPPPPKPAAKEVEPPPTADRATRQPMSRLRKTLADRLVAAQQTAAILTTFNECDMSQVQAIRQQFKESFKERHGVALGFMGFFVKAVIEALKAYPIVNAQIDGSDIIQPNQYDIGVAVSTDRGLMVPVIRAADRLSFAKLEQAIADYAARARDGRITVDDLRGGTFTITNGGVFGSLLSTPILNPPQSGILGMHAIQKRPVVVNDQIVIRPMMYLALSYDHRLIDGREAVQFLVKVKEVIENPLQLFLGF